MENIIKVIFIGIITGITASFIGGGAEILIVPLLIYLNVVDNYKEAIGTSLASLLLPIGIIAVYYYQKNNKNVINWTYALILSFSFVIGTIASRYSSQIDASYLKRIFGLLTVLLGTIILFE